MFYRTSGRITSPSLLWSAAEKAFCPRKFFMSSCERKAFFIRPYKEAKISAPLVLIHRRSRMDRTSNSAATSSAYPAGLKIPARRK